MKKLVAIRKKIINLDELIRIESIRERDIDLVILEEIYSSKNFRHLIYSKIDISVESSFIGAWHSIHSFNLGESDIVLKFKKKEGDVILILIENKINANFTSNQILRYNQRADLHVENKDCDEAHVLLIAPSKYLKGVTQNVKTLSYEEIRSYFLNDKQIANERSRYKSLFLEYAIEKERRGYSPLIDEHVTSFQHSYFELSDELFPKLKMKKPRKGVPSGSGFLYFAPIGIRKEISLVHKFIAKGDENFLDIQFNQQIEYMKKFEKEYRNQLDSDLSIESANKSFVVRKRIKKIDIHESFEEQKSELINSLEELNKLYKWILENYRY